MTQRPAACSCAAHAGPLPLWRCGGAVQAAYVYSLPSVQGSYPGEGTGCVQAGSLHGAARALLVRFSPWLEARWPDTTYDFYSQGAYALTMARFNGFFEEASALSAMVGVFFVPLAFGLLEVAGNNRRRVFAGFGMLACCMAVLTFCRSGTGQILAAVSLLLTLAFGLRGRFKCSKILMTVTMTLVCLFAALYAPHVPDYLLNRMKRQDLEKLPRVTVTLDTLELIAEHPFLGVGRNWYFPHLHNGRRYMQNLADPELRDWKEKGTGGELSALPALAAQYGLVVLAAAFIFVGNVWLRLRRLRIARPLTTRCVLRQRPVRHGWF